MMIVEWNQESNGYCIGGTVCDVAPMARHLESSRLRVHAGVQQNGESQGGRLTLHE